MRSPNGLSVFLTLRTSKSSSSMRRRFICVSGSIGSPCLSLRNHYRESASAFGKIFNIQIPAAALRRYFIRNIAAISGPLLRAYFLCRRVLEKYFFHSFVPHLKQPRFDALSVVLHGDTRPAAVGHECRTNRNLYLPLTCMIDSILNNGFEHFPQDELIDGHRWQFFIQLKDEFVFFR